MIMSVSTPLTFCVIAKYFYPERGIIYMIINVQVEGLQRLEMLVYALAV